MSYIPITPLIEGFATALGLFVAIGPQNAFVLKQSLQRNHILMICLICIVIDTIMIAMGVSGLGIIITQSNKLLLLAKYGGAIFLFLFGLNSFQAAFRNESMKIDLSSKKLSIKKAVLALLAMSLLNPHVYLDNCILIGSIGAQFPEQERIYFIIGACFGSVAWFTLLGYGAKFLIPFFQKPSSWKVLDCIIGVIMWLIAYSLLI